MKIFSILSSILLLLPTRTPMKACGFIPDAEEVRYMVFNPDIVHNKSWWSFFYSARYNYRDGDITSLDDEDMLVRQWISQLHSRAKNEEVFSCLFTDLSDSAKSVNSFYHEIQKNPDVKKYFEMAKRSEALSELPSPWQEDEAKERQRSLDRDQTVKDLLAQLRLEENSFLQRKYAFQVVKLTYYADDAITFNRIYNKYFKDRHTDVLDWWAMHYKSMMLERLNYYDSANYLHALVFSHSSNKMFASKQIFSRKNLPDVLALAKNDRERADIYLLAEVINPGRALNGIMKVYSHEPNHPHIPLLICREINKLEDWMGAEKYANVSPATDSDADRDNYPDDQHYLSQFIEALQEMNVIEKARPDFYNLSMAYLHLLNKDGTKAGIFLNKIKSENAEVQYQRNALEIIRLTLAENIKLPSVQDKIGVLFEKLIAGRFRKFESQKLLYSLSSYLRYTFANANMIYLAGLFDNYAINKFCFDCDWVSFEYSLIQYLDKHAQISDMNRLIEIYHSNNKNTLERILLKPYSNPYFFYDLLSVKYLREDQVADALGVLQKVPDGFWNTFYNASFYLDRDPFMDNAELFGIQTMTSFNRREILEKLLNLERQAEQNPSARALNYFLLGNAWYNFTQNSWFMISYGWSVGEVDYPVYAAFARKKAFNYYHQAIEYERDNERRAKLFYMLALLSPETSRKQFAKEFESYKTTSFYERKNCLTLKELASN